MACLFGHKWNGCTCARCGARRDENHQWEPMEGRWHEQCSICGKARPYSGTLNAACMSPDDRRIIDDALTFVMHLNIDGNANVVNECAKLSSKLAQTPTLLTTGDLQLSTATVTQYARSIPTLVEVNPLYAEHKAQLQEDYQYIGATLLPELVRLFGHLAVPATLTIIRDSSAVSALAPTIITLNGVHVATLSNGGSVVIRVDTSPIVLQTNCVGSKDVRYELDVPSGACGEIHVKANVFQPKLTVWKE